MRLRSRSKTATIDAMNIAATESAMSSLRRVGSAPNRGDAEHGEVEAQQQVDRDLGRRGGEERRGHRRRIGVGVRQPRAAGTARASG